MRRGSVGQLRFNGRGMSAFPVAAAPSSEKLRGGYYTPLPIAEFLARWVAGAGLRLLEPSCGDGAILHPLSAESASVVGVEIESDEAAKARQACPQADVVTADFYDWFTQGQRCVWDGVAGNPPFIRFGNWAGPQREAAFDVMREVGMRPTKLTNAWVPFVVASALALRDGGRLGMVLPAELLQVGYTAELRALLVDEFAELTVITFKRLVFEDVLQEVVLLLGTRGRGPAEIRVVEVADIDDLPDREMLEALPRAPALRHDSEKWTKYFLTPEEIEALRRIRALGSIKRLGEIADVDVGIVTGRNQFFVMNPSRSASHGIERHVSPLVSKSAHLRGVRFDARDLEGLRDSDALCELLALESSIDPDSDDALLEYITSGEAAGVHEGYKCSIRRQWWVVPSQWTPDAFLLRQIHDHPRIIANLTAATSTDTIHRVRMLNAVPAVKLAAASVNSMTFAFAEVMGRSYGGGVLELEPTEAEGLPFPDPAALTATDVVSVDELLRRGELNTALDYVDERLLPDLDESTITELRSVWARLRDRRLARGRRRR